MNERKLYFTFVAVILLALTTYQAKAVIECQLRLTQIAPSSRPVAKAFRFFFDNHKYWYQPKIMLGSGFWMQPIAFSSVRNENIESADLAKTILRTAVVGEFGKAEYFSEFTLLTNREAALMNQERETETFQSGKLWIETGKTDDENRGFLESCLGDWSAPH